MNNDMEENPMYGWRGKIGYVCPAINDTVMLEFYSVAPKGLLITSVDLKIQNLVDKELAQAMTGVEEAVRILDLEEVQAFIVGGTPPIIKLGFDADKEIIRKIESLTGKPASTEPTLEMEALTALSLKRIAIVSPYADERKQHIKSFFEYSGFEVAMIKGLGITKNVDIAQLRFNASYLLACEAFSAAKGAVDGILLTCPRWPTVSCIDPLEKELGIPVVTTAQATVWKALMMLGIREVPAGYGTLFAGFTRI